MTRLQPGSRWKFSQHRWRTWCKGAGGPRFAARRRIQRDGIYAVANYAFHNRNLHAPIRLSGACNAAGQLHLHARHGAADRLDLPVSPPLADRMLGRPARVSEPGLLRAGHAVGKLRRSGNVLAAGPQPTQFAKWRVRLEDVHAQLRAHRRADTGVAAADRTGSRDLPDAPGQD